ncbi:hypothetical protein PR048_021065 [Dryococelus australis]|uniref:Uncharacterized protein n=1 Tax=Dryococelus australis TaxID=614101 RepID=A0ABQ9GX60_9NEOP|nr:hypothetical protein PR048_021065 [Dryococelus australis]
MKVIRYPNLSSAIRPVGHGPDLHVPKPPEVLDDIILDVCSDAKSDADEQADEFECTDNLEPNLITPTELNDLVRDLVIMKEKAELVGSRLQENKLLAVGTNVYLYRRKERSFSQFLKQEGFQYTARILMV